MNELDSQFCFQPLESNSNFLLNFADFETPFVNKELSLFDTHQTLHEQIDNQSEKSPKRDRVDNNIFKTPLSQFRKLMKHFFAKKKIQSNAFAIINQENRNFSTFPKYWVLCTKIGCKDQLKELFKAEKCKILERKKTKMSHKRYQELEKVYERMLKSLECTDVEQAMKEYWGRFRQKSKFAESYEEIGKFQKFLETIIK